MVYWVAVALFIALRIMGVNKVLAGFTTRQMKPERYLTNRGLQSN